MYVFVDESGDLGFSKKSTRHFVMASLITLEPKKIGKMFKKIRIRLIKKKYKSIPEFKWSKSDEFLKKEVLKRLSKEEIIVGYVLLRKNKVYSYLQDKKNIIYNYLTSSLLGELIESNEKEIKIVVDKSLSKINRENFNEYLNLKLAYLLEGSKDNPLVVIKHENSGNSPGIQAADFVAGAVFNKYEFNNEEYFKIIENKIKYKVEKW